MGQVRSLDIRTTLSSHRLACDAYDEMTRGVKLPESRATYFRKLRAPSQEPNPLARLMAHQAELAAHGVTEVALRLPALLLTAHVDALFGGTRALDATLLAECVAHENAENAVEVAVMCGDRSPETLRAFARAKRREGAVDFIAATAADMEAARLTRGMR